jgi:feruloyl esterase
VLAVNNGYAAASTDGGHPSETADLAAPANWALFSPGNLNLPLLQDFAAVALSDMTLLGQAITESYYGEKPAYSYWTGCSTGGRQGLMLAQRYPELYDGIVAVAPAINWDTFLVTEYWPQQVMNQLGVYPPPCEIKAFTNAAIAACDNLDGLEDGVISDTNACTFDPYSVVGENFSCDDGEERKFTIEGAKVAEAAWSGPTDSSRKRQWYGLSKDAALSGIAGTNGTTSTGKPFRHSADW